MTTDVKKAQAIDRKVDTLDYEILKGLENICWNLRIIHNFYDTYSFMLHKGFLNFERSVACSFILKMGFTYMESNLLNILRNYNELRNCYKRHLHYEDIMRKEMKERIREVDALIKSHMYTFEDVTVDTDLAFHNDVHGEDCADELKIKEDVGAIVIADGVTEGCDGGEIAAKISCKTFLDFLEKNYNKYHPFSLLRRACEEAGKRVREIAEDAFEGGDEWKKFVSEKNEREYEKRIEKSRDKNRVPIFASTLIAAYYIGNVVYTLHVGDGYILSVDVSNNRIHPYLAGSSPLHELIISEEKSGIRGEPYISSFLLKDGELLVIGSDGANIGYTPRGGFPFVEFIKHLKRDCGEIKGCGEGWYEFLKEREAISDDFSIGIMSVKCRRKDVR